MIIEGLAFYFIPGAMMALGASLTGIGQFAI
jgi:hypothetical protein